MKMENQNTSHIPGGLACSLEEERLYRGILNALFFRKATANTHISLFVTSIRCQGLRCHFANKPKGGINVSRT